MNSEQESIQLTDSSTHLEDAITKRDIALILGENICILCILKRKTLDKRVGNCLATLPTDFTSIPDFYDQFLSADDPTKIQRSLSKALKAQRKEYIAEHSDE